MPASRFTLTRCALSVLVVATLLLVPASVASANVRLPEGDVPYYARIATGEIYHTDAWVAIVFYRPPACIPSDFDLLTRFTWAAFGCTPPTTSGFAIWEHGPMVDLAPKQIELKGLGAVPIWFVTWADLQAAMVDGNLTIAELSAMPSLLVGSASYYHETLHPIESANHGFSEFNARGVLSDGRTFKYHAVMKDLQLITIAIDFK
jgi:hypothetical protein